MLTEITVLGTVWFAGFLFSLCAIAFALLLQKVWPTFLEAVAAILVSAISANSELGV
jgi:hypothetical protein